MKLQENDQKRNSNNNIRKITVTSLSAMAAETTTFPLDITKTRLQLHGESLSHAAARRASAFQIAGKIVRNEGLNGLYKGLSPAIIRHLFYTPTRIVGYEHLRNVFVTSYDQELSFLDKAVIGGCSGAIAQEGLRRDVIFVVAWIPGVPIPCILDFIKRKNEEVVFDRIKQPHENAKTIAK